MHTNTPKIHNSDNCGSLRIRFCRIGLVIATGRHELRWQNVWLRHVKIKKLLLVVTKHEGSRYQPNNAINLPETPPIRLLVQWLIGLMVNRFIG